MARLLGKRWRFLVFCVPHENATVPRGLPCNESPYNVRLEERPAVDEQPCTPLGEFGPEFLCCLLRLCGVFHRGIKHAIRIRVSDYCDQ